MWIIQLSYWLLNTCSYNTRSIWLYPNWLNFTIVMIIDYYYPHLSWHRARGRIKSNYTVLFYNRKKAVIHRGTEYKLQSNCLLHSSHLQIMNKYQLVVLYLKSKLFSYPLQLKCRMTTEKILKNYCNCNNNCQTKYIFCTIFHIIAEKNKTIFPSFWLLKYKWNNYYTNCIIWAFILIMSTMYTPSFTALAEVGLVFTLQASTSQCRMCLHIT